MSVEISGWRKRQVLKMAEQASLSRQDWWKDDEALERFAEQVREEAQAEEREACAKIADSQLRNTNALLTAPIQSSAAYQIGVAIRARGQA